MAARFEAYSYGPFEESIETDVDFLSSEGLIEATGRQTLPEVRTYDPERGKRIVEWVRSRGLAPDDSSVEEYRLTRAGMEWVQRFLASDQYGDPDVKKKFLSRNVESFADGLAGCRLRN